MLTCSESALNIIKTHEGLRLVAYLCPANRLTIGYGHVLLPKFDCGLFSRVSAETLARIINECQSRRRMTQEALVVLRINPEQAERLLLGDASQVGRFLLSVTPVPLNQHQFDALVSLVFNLGQGHYATSTLRKKLHAMDYAGAAAEFDKWVFGTVNGQKQKLPGLITRRAVERALFEAPV